MDNLDLWVPVCGWEERMVVWTEKGMFGTCFATLVFSYIGHFTAIGVTAFYLGRFPKSTVVREPFELPKLFSYIVQLMLTLLICDPLIKLIVVIFVNGKQNSFVEDFKLMLMFTTWALNLTYYRRLAISNYIRLPGIVAIVAACAFLFVCQIPVVLSSAYKEDHIDLGFLVAYQVLLFLAILAYIILFFNVKTTLFKTYPYNLSSQHGVDESGTSGSAPIKSPVPSTEPLPPVKTSGVDNPSSVIDEM